MSPSIEQEVAILQRLTQEVVNEFSAVAGCTLEAPQMSTWSFSATGEGDFKALVSDCYKWWREIWGDEIEFIGRLARDARAADLRLLTRNIRLLRTAQQHTDNQEAVEFEREWYRLASGSSSPVADSEWEDCARALAALMARALSALLAIVASIGGDERAIAKWRERVVAQASANPVLARERVSQDLRIDFPTHRVAHIDREIAYLWRQRTRTAVDNAQAAVESVVERYLIGVSVPLLPCDHNDVLEELDLLGDQLAVPALLIAHGVAGAGAYSDVSEFLEAVKTVWASVSAP